MYAASQSLVRSCMKFNHFNMIRDGPCDFFMLGEEYLAPQGKSTPGSRRVTPSKTLPTEVRTPNSRRNRQFGGSIPRISAHTVHRVLTSEIQCNYLLVDCRYGYEYEGGHIVGAINCPPSEKLVLMDWLFDPDHGIIRRGPLVLVMHCEFSQCRAPRMATDVFRQYISLGLHTGFEVYVMKGGYSDFYRHYPQWCDPVGYVPMHDHRTDSATHAAEFDPDMFMERCSLSSQKDRRSSRRFRAGLSIGAGPASLPSDSPFFQASTSIHMDYSPVGVVADLARVFEDHNHPPHDDSSSGGSAVSRRGAVYINTDEDSGCDDHEEEDIGLVKLMQEESTSSHFLPSESPSRASSSSSIFPRTSFPYNS